MSYDPKENAVRFLVAMLQNPNADVSMAGWQSVGDAVTYMTKTAVRLADELDKQLTEQGVIEE